MSPGITLLIMKGRMSGLFWPGQRGPHPADPATALPYPSQPIERLWTVILRVLKCKTTNIKGALRLESMYF